MQPIYAAMQGTEMSSKINSFMDHVWDGFYTGQTRQSRFPALVYAPKGSVYDLTFTGSPAKKMKFKLISQDNKAGMTVRIAYPSAQSRAITLNGKIVEMNQWDEGIRGYGPIKQTTCGENRYIGVKNILEFFITADCTLQIQPRDAIQTMVRMEWTMDEFFAGGGTTSFMDRVAGSLGIHASTIKVVSVYDGSVVLNYDITPDTGQTSADLATIKAKQTQQFATGTMNLGAPILDVAVTTSSSTTSSTEDTPAESVISGGVVSAKGYDPVVLTKTTANQNGGSTSAGAFVPKIPIMQVNQTVYNQRTITQNKYKDAPSITIINGKNGTAVMIMLAAAGLLLIVGLLMIFKCIINRMRQSKIDRLYISSVNKELSKKNQTLPSKGSGQGSSGESADKMNAEIEYMEEQYDPNQEFRIFGVGDPTKGGV